MPAAATTTAYVNTAADPATATDAAVNTATGTPAATPTAATAAAAAAASAAITTDATTGSDADAAAAAADSYTPATSPTDVVQCEGGTAKGVRCKVCSVGSSAPIFVSAPLRAGGRFCTCHRKQA